MNIAARLVVITTFLWSNLAWALAPATGLPAVTVDLIALDSIQDLAGEDIRIFYKEISGGKRGFGIRDTSGDNNKWAFYVVDLERGEFIRYLSSRDVDDRFFSLLNTIEGQVPVSETIFKPNGREYIKQEFRITDRTRPFIKACLSRIPSREKLIVQAGNDDVLIAEHILSLYPDEIAWVREHAKRVARIAEIIARRMQLGDELIRLIRIAALAHDLGKGSSPEMIAAANSSGPKMPILDAHREESLRMLEKADVIVDDVVRQAILYHHDPWLTRGEIPRLVTEIIYLADQIDASQDSHRPYPTTMISLQQLMSEFRSYYKIGERVSKPVYKAFHRLLIEGQSDLMDVIHEARGEVRLSEEEIERRLSGLFDSVLRYRPYEQTLSLRWDRDINAVDLGYFYRYVSGIEGLGQGEREHLIMNLLLAIVSSTLDISGYGAMKPLSDLVLLDRMRSDNIRSHAREFRNNYDQSGEKSRQIIDLLRRIKRDVPEDLKPFVHDFITRCRYLQRGMRHHPPMERAEESGDGYMSISEILGLIVPDSPELIEMVARWWSDNRFLELSDVEQERLLGGIAEEEVRQVVRNLQNVIRLFNDLNEAERQRPRVIRRFNGVRVVGRVSDRVRKLVGYIARSERLDLPETPDITRPRYIVVNKDREKNRLEDILRQRYDIHVVTEIPSDGKFVVLVNPEDVGKWEGQNLFYLPLPYMEQSLKLAAGMLLGNKEIAHNYVKDFYNILLGRNLSDEEVANLFRKPWWILPEISALVTDLIILREAISQLEKSA